MQTLSSQGKPKRKQRATFHLVTQEPDPPQPDPPSPLPSSITSLISARASLMSASSTPNSHRAGGHPVSDRQKALPLPLPPAYEAPSFNSPSRKPPTHESTTIANSPLRTTPSFEQTAFNAKSPLRSATGFESALAPSTPVRTAPAYEPALTAKSPLRNASSYEPLISANSPLRMLPSYQRRIISPSASPMKQTPSGSTAETVESRQHHSLGASESRQNALGGSTESRHNKGAEPRTSALAGFESIRSKNGAFSSMDLMRSKNTATGAGSSQPGSARKKDAVPASPVAKREKENMRSTLRESRR